MHQLLAHLSKTPAMQDIRRAGEGGKTPCSVFGVCENARAQIIACNYQGGQTLVVTHQDMQAGQIASQLRKMLDVPVLRLPPPRVLPSLPHQACCCYHNQ